MTATTTPATTFLHDAVLAVLLLAIDPQGLGGAILRGPFGPVRNRWLMALQELLPRGTPVRKVPPNIADDRLLGGLDLTQTLALGRPMVEKGTLAEAHGGIVIVPSAERLGAATAAHLSAALDNREVCVERDGLAARLPAAFAVVALDEALADERGCPSPLCDRLAFHLALDDVRDTDLNLPPDSTAAVMRAQSRLDKITLPDQLIEALTAAAVALGIQLLRAPLLAVMAARAAAALAGKSGVTDEDAAVAARLVLAPRATQLPSSAEPPEVEEPPPPEMEDQTLDSPRDEQNSESPEPPTDVVLAAALAALPPDLLAALAASSKSKQPASGAGAGDRRQSARRGRPIGSLPGKPRAGSRLDLVATLRAAAPWQRLRRTDRCAGSRLVEVRGSDVRIKRFAERTETLTIFVVDASGSEALHRLAEAEGAVELLLAECYIRRDQVALIAYRGRKAELLLPPTHALARAKRALADLAGGGATPLASGVLMAESLALAARRKGQTAFAVVLTDGRPNIARDGGTGRPAAEADALSAARLARDAGLRALVIDLATRQTPFAAALAEAMAARYVAMPDANAGKISNVTRAAAALPARAMSA